MSLAWSGSKAEDFGKWFWIILILFVLLGGFGVIFTDRIKRIANAFAVAEGFYANGDPLPKRANNPGDLKLGDKGNGVIDGKTVFATVADGWNALYKQVGLMVTGLSRYYKPSMTLREVAVIYTGADAAESWAQHAAKVLGVTPDTKLSEIV